MIEWTEIMEAWLKRWGKYPFSKVKINYRPSSGRTRQVLPSMASRALEDICVWADASGSMEPNAEWERRKEIEAHVNATIAKWKAASS